MQRIHAKMFNIEMSLNFLNRRVLRIVLRSVDRSVSSVADIENTTFIPLYRGLIEHWHRQGCTYTAFNKHISMHRRSYDTDELPLQEFQTDIFRQKFSLYCLCNIISFDMEDLR